MGNTKKTNNSEDLENKKLELQIENNFYAELDNLQALATENIMYKYLTN